MTPSASAPSVPGQRPQVPVGDARRAAAERVDDDQPRAVAARLEDQAPQVRRRRERVPAPHDDRARVHPLLGIDLGRRRRSSPSCPPRPRSRRSCARASSRRSPSNSRLPIDVALHDALRAEVAVGDDRRAAVPLDRVARCPAAATSSASSQPTCRNCALALGARAHERMQQPLRRVHALEVVRHLAAQEARRDRVLGVALDARGAARGVDLDEQRARVGAIVRAGPADDSGGGAHGGFDPTTRADDPPETPSFRSESYSLGCYGRRRGAM